MMNALNARVTDFAQDSGVFHFSRGRFASAETAHPKCFGDFLSPLPPNCIYCEEGWQWVSNLECRSSRFAAEEFNDDFHS
jgi:hypothetical protein